MSVYLVGGEGRAPPSRRAVGQSIQMVAGPGMLPFTLLQLLLRSHWKSQRAGEPQGQYSVSKTVFLPHCTSLACADSEAARVSSTPVPGSCESRRCAGWVMWPLKPLPDGLGGSDFLSQPPRAACKSFQKQGSSGGKHSKLEKSRCLEGEFPPHIGSKVNFERAEVKTLSSYWF